MVQNPETTQYCRWRLTKSCCLTVDWKCTKRNWKGISGYLYQPMGCRHNYAINGRNFVFFGSGSGVVDFDWWRNIFEKEIVFIFLIRIRLFDKTMCAIATKQHNCRFLGPERNIQNVAAGFALFAVVDTRRFIGWNKNTLFNSTCWTIHISNSLLYLVVHGTKFFLSKFGWLKGTLLNNYL